MSSDESSPPFNKSTYPELKLPDKWESSIPEHLLDGADPQTLFIMHELSKNSQAIEWACHGLIDTNAQVRRTNGRLIQAEKDIKKETAALAALTAKADLMEPLFKPLSLLMRMWEYKYFRWATYLLVFFFFTYLLPFYLQNPMSLSGLWALFFGT